jgi:hypothetical protein
VLSAVELRKSLAVSSRARGLAATFVRLTAHDGWAATRGLCQIQLPEVEIELDEWPDANAAKRLVGTFAVAFIDGRIPAVPSGERIINVGGFRCRLERGRRGSVNGHSYGLHGAVIIRPAEGDPKRQSSDRISLHDGI